MRLLYVCTDFGIPPGGTKGASIHLRSITSALARLGHDVRLLSPLSDHTGSVTVPLLDTPGRSGVRREARALRDWMESHGFDSAVSKEFRSLSYGAMAPGAALETMGDWRPDAIIERLSLFGHVGVDLARACAVPLIVEVNALLTEEASAFRSLELRGIAAAIEQRVLDRADAVVAVSAALARLIIDRGHPADKVHVVPNGVETAMFEEDSASRTLRRELNLDGAFVIGFCGSLKPWHGVDILIQAFDLMQGDGATSRLLIVGSGPSEDALKAMVQSRGLQDRVIFTGAVPHEHIAAYLQVMDVGAAPFRSMDNFYFSPIKLFEYMAAGACVVASELGQISEVIQHGGTGLLCPPDDPQALCDALREVRDDAPRRARLAVAARRDALDNHTWSRAARSVERIILGTRSRSAYNGTSAHSASQASGPLRPAGPGRDRLEVVS